MKKNISDIDAQKQLLDTLDNPNSVQDGLYELGKSLFFKGIDKLNKENNIVGFDGTTYLDEDDVAWYDDIEQEFMDKFYGKVLQMFNK